MNEHNIKQSNRVFILGAGGSRELKFISHTLDVNRISEREHFELGPLSSGFFYYANKFNKTLPNITKLSSGIKLYDPLANYIIKYYRNKFKNSINKNEILENKQKSYRINIEELFSYIENDIDRYKIEHCNNNLPDNLLESPYQTRVDLTNYIFDVFTMISNYCFSIYHRIFAYYVIRNDWNVVSFNWDILFDEEMYYTKHWNYKDGYGLKIDNIFDLTGKAHNSLLNSCSNNLILKPHGSINWYLKNNGANLIGSKNLTIFLPWERRLRGGNNRRLCNFMYEKQKDNAQIQYKNILMPPSRKRNLELKIYNKIWNSTKKILEEVNEIIVIGFSFNEFDEYVLDEFRRINFKKNVKINIVDPQGNLLIKKFKDIFRTNEGNIKIIHDSFSDYCKWIVQQNSMTDLQGLLR